tara:strand:- start:120 stop:887 length:768 start_codon:yes stop_codon:yes gene_type:complete
MSAVSQTKKLKITVTNIRSVLMKRTKRLTNLKKIKKRDTKNLLSSQKKRSAESKLESPLKGIKKIGSGIGSGISNMAQTATGINPGGIFKAIPLLGLGIGANLLFDNFDEIKEGAKNLKKKIDEWWEKGKKMRRQIEEGLSYIDGTKLKEMSEKFSKQTEKLEEEFEKLNNPNSVYTIPDPNNPDKQIRISAKKFWLRQIKNEEERTGTKIRRTEEKDFSNVEPIKKDTNLSSLLNSNGSSGDTVILARQPIHYT